MKNQKSKVKTPSSAKVSEGKQNSANKGRATSMAQLLAGVRTPFVTLNKGATLKGTITKLTPSEILVDINAKTEAVVLEKDRKILRNILSLFKVGEQVNVSVLNPESDFGHPVVSLRRYVDDLLWEKLSQKQKDKETISVVIEEVIKGGFLVDTDFGVSGFMPNSQAISTTTEEDSVGRKIQAYVLELNRQAHKLILSQKPILGDEEFAKLTKNIKVDQKISARITSITPFGIFVSVSVSDKDEIDGLIHISEISWDKTVDPASVGAVSEMIEASVIGVDKEAKRIDLSLKRLTEDPFAEKMKSFSVDQKVSGVVSQISASGVVVDLNGVEGFIRREKIPPTLSFEVGSQLSATVSQIDAKRRRIILVPVLLRKTIGYR